MPRGTIAIKRKEEYNKFVELFIPFKDKILKDLSETYKVDTSKIIMIPFKKLDEHSMGNTWSWSDNPQNNVTLSFRFKVYYNKQILGRYRITKTANDVFNDKIGRGKTYFGRCL